MTKRLKVSLIVISILILIVVVGRFIVTNIFREAFGSDCEKLKSWTIGEYKIQEYRCLG